MEESVCIICNKSDDKQVYEIKKTALNRLVASSKKRIDNKYKKFETLTSALIHRTCQSHYNDETAIAAFCSSRRASAPSWLNDKDSILGPPSDQGLWVCAFSALMEKRELV
ncbi:hypothetical protein EVAR_56477_1 [Eumeta japonica]|uniref:Uncharacterized protein n=1 Tax=Eumeta variegata TaxID=151549 RepID=A0A4C1XHJ0_EUMVA|nr:hypothetical protein EVAR_56477_1 [Eumeta japonica]